MELAAAAAEVCSCGEADPLGTNSAATRSAATLDDADGACVVVALFEQDTGRLVRRVRLTSTLFVQLCALRM